MNVATVRNSLSPSGEATFCSKCGSESSDAFDITYNFSANSYWLSYPKNSSRFNIWRISNPIEDGSRYSVTFENGNPILTKIDRHDCLYDHQNQ